MLPRKTVQLSLPAAMLGLLIIISGCSSESSSASDSSPAGPPAAAGGSRPQGDRGGAPATATAQVENLSRMIQVGGRLHPRTSIKHTAPAGGLIKELAVTPGDRVEAGTILFTVDRNEAGQTFRPVPLKARIGGIVSVVEVLPEQEVSEGEAGVTIIGRDGYTLDAKVSDKDAFTVAPGQPVRARTAGDELISGRLLRRSPEPDYATGLFNLTFEFPVSAGAFTGAFVLVELPAETLRGIFVPTEAIDRRYGRNFLWVISSEDEILERRELTLGKSLMDRTMVVEGLAAGETFLTRLSGREREGAPAAGGRP